MQDFGWLTHICRGSAAAVPNLRGRSAWASLAVPAHALTSLTGTGDADTAPQWPALSDHLRDGAAACGFDSLYRLQNGLSLAASEVEGERFGVSHSATVPWGGQVSAEQLEL